MRSLLPLTTVQKKLLGQEWLRWIMVSAVSRDASYVAQRQIVSLLRDRHKIRPGDRTTLWCATWRTSLMLRPNRAPS